MRLRKLRLVLVVLVLLLTVVLPTAAQGPRVRGTATLTSLTGTVQHFNPNSGRGVATIRFSGQVTSGPQAGQPLVGLGLLRYIGDINDGTDIFMLERGQLRLQVTVGDGEDAVTVEGRATLGSVALGYLGDIQDGTDIFMTEGDSAEMRYLGDINDGTDI